MNAHISETAPIRTIETLINEAKSLGLRVVHRPDTKPSNVVKLPLLDESDIRHMQMCVSPEAA